MIFVPSVGLCKVSLHRRTDLFLREVSESPQGESKAFFNAITLFFDELLGGYDVRNQIILPDRVVVLQLRIK